MYYLKSRYYDPEVCRFINADAFVSTGQGIIGYNMFAYCLNNPVKHRDDAGRYTVTTYEYSSECENEYGTVPITGTIYIYTGISDYRYFDDPEHRPEGYIDGRDVIVLDLRGNDNPNMIVYNSYLITGSTQQNDLISVLLDYDKNHPSKKEWGRKRRSLLTEWTWHNLFASFSVEARHVDFDHDEEGMGGGYYIHKAWERSFIGPKLISLAKRAFIIL